MQLQPMASSPDGLISARYAVITKTPGRGRGGGGVVQQCPAAQQQADSRAAELFSGTLPSPPPDWEAVPGSVHAHSPHT